MDQLPLYALDPGVSQNDFYQLETSIGRVRSRIIVMQLLVCGYCKTFFSKV